MQGSWVQAGRRGVFLGLLALVGATGVALAQTGRIEGTVKSTTTGNALPDVQVSVVGRNLSARTDAKGFYRIEDVAPGTYSLQAAAVGYSPLTETNVVVSAGSPTTANIQMSPAVVSLSEVVVTGTVGATKKADLPFTVATVRSEDLPVPPTNALQEIEG